MTTTLSGTLYAPPLCEVSAQVHKILITAKYSKCNIKFLCEAPDFEFGVTNQTESFLKKFPLGKIPAFECESGFCLSDSDAIAYYVSSPAMRGDNCIKTKSIIMQYTSLAAKEIRTCVIALCYPALGIVRTDKNETTKATTEIHKILQKLNNILLEKTYLVGERISLADIALACELVLLFTLNLEENDRKKYVNVTRWFLTCVNQPEFKSVLGDIKLCLKTAQFDGKAYAQLHASEKQTKQPKAKPDNQPSKEVKPQAKAEQPAEPKKPKPFSNLEPSTMDLDEWKRMYSNNDTLSVAMPWFWEHLDKKGYSLWFTEYLYEDELTRSFVVANMIKGVFSRLETANKYLFASFLVCGQDNNYTLKGVWLMRGQELLFTLDPDWGCDMDVFKFNKLNPDDDNDRALVNKYFSWEGDFTTKPFSSGYVFK